ncbi:unnamed protein product, partial [Durusdinium trenchii]
MAAPVSSRVRKRNRQGVGTRPEGAVLSNADLTKAFLQQENELRALHHSLTLALKFVPDAPVASQLMEAVKTWQTAHQKGRPHPFGACGTATATVLFQFLLKNLNEDQSSHVAWCLLKDLMEHCAPANVAGEVAHCSARLSKQETHVILELRFHASSIFAPHASWFKSLLLQQKGEVLGAKPMSGLARKDDRYGLLAAFSGATDYDY